jgi:XTP/dITP diphosphohydrolase
MSGQKPPTKNGVAGLIELMDLLRSKDGCPWDNEQTHQSLIEYLLEESYEFAEAVESGNRQAIREELGDVLLQVVFHSKIAQEHLQDPFNIDDVADVITNKLIKRHPHIFSDSKDLTSLEVENNWEMIKQKEKSRTSITDGVPVAMPALMHADKLITRVKSVKDEIAQVKETQLVNHVKKDLNSEEEVGQFLLSFVAMCNERGIDSESALRKAISQYRDEIKKSEN